MNLRARLVVGVLAAALPVAILATVWEVGRDRDRRVEIVRERATARMELVGQDACESNPFDFPYVQYREPEFSDWLLGDDVEPAPPGPGEDALSQFVFDEQLVSARRDAPRIPPRMREQFTAGASSVTWIGRRNDAAAGRGPGPGRARARQRLVERTLVRAPWSSRDCAALLIERPPPPRQSLRAHAMPALLVTFAVLLAVALVAGPVVLRIRRLIAAVHLGNVRDTETTGTDEIAELADAFRAREATIGMQLAELAEREAALREHLAATSHDVLLPITVLQGHLVEIEAALEGGAAPSPEIVRGALEETHYVAALVRDLNADVRLRSGLIVTDASVDLVAVVERAVARHRPIARRSGISVEAATPEAAVLVNGDPTLLEQLVSNLVHNAVRYVETDGHVAVVLETTRAGFRLEVKDDGPGVSDSALGQLGTRGFRSDEARSRRPEGMGLGLHIVREVAAKHGLALHFAHVIPRGLSVVVEGPCGPAGASAPLA